MSVPKWTPGNVSARLRSFLLKYFFVLKETKTNANASTRMGEPKPALRKV